MLSVRADYVLSSPHLAHLWRNSREVFLEDLQKAFLNGRYIARVLQRKINVSTIIRGDSRTFFDNDHSSFRTMRTHEVTRFENDIGSRDLILLTGFSLQCVIRSKQENAVLAGKRISPYLAQNHFSGLEVGGPIRDVQFELAFQIFLDSQRGCLGFAAIAEKNTGSIQPAETENHANKIIIQ